MRSRGRSDAGAEGAVVAGKALAGKALAGAAGVSAGFCSKMMLRSVGDQGTRALSRAQAVSFGGFVGGGRWMSCAVPVQRGQGVGTPQCPHLPSSGFVPTITAGAGGRCWWHGDSLPEVPVSARRHSPGRWVLGAGCSTGLEEVAGETWLSSATKHGTRVLSLAGEGLSSSFLMFPTRNPS